MAFLVYVLNHVVGGSDLLCAGETERLGHFLNCLRSGIEFGGHSLNLSDLRRGAHDHDLFVVRSGKNRSRHARQTGDLGLVSTAQDGDDLRRLRVLQLDHNDFPVG